MNTSHFHHSRWISRDRCFDVECSELHGKSGMAPDHYSLGQLSHAAKICAVASWTRCSPLVEHKNLYFFGSAHFPPSTTANRTLTITVLTFRASRRRVGGFGSTVDPDDKGANDAVVRVSWYLRRSGNETLFRPLPRSIVCNQGTAVTGIHSGQLRFQLFKKLYGFEHIAAGVSKSSSPLLYIRRTCARRST